MKEKPYQINCGDVLEETAKIPAESVDLIITSPPYNKAGLEGFIRKRHKTDSWSNGRNIEYNGQAENDFMPEAAYQKWQIQVLNECFRVLKNGGSMFYNHKNRVKDYVLYSPLSWIFQTNFNVRQEITWLRNGSPSAAPIRFLSNTEKLFWLFKGEKPIYFNPECFAYSEVWNIPFELNTLHPAPFPVELAKRCIRACSKPAETVLDIFAGSCSTGVACAIENRNFIGIDINEKYCQLGEARIERALGNPVEIPQIFTGSKPMPLFEFSET